MKRKITQTKYFHVSGKFAKDLKAALKEVIAYQAGELDLYSEYIEISESSTAYKTKEIKTNEGLLCQDIKDI